MRQVYITQIDGISNESGTLKRRLILEQDAVHWTMRVPNVLHFSIWGKKNKIKYFPGTEVSMKFIA